VKSVDNLVNGRWVQGDGEREVLHKFTGETLAILQEADRQIVVDAVTAAHDAFEAGILPPPKRFEILSRVAQMIADNKDSLAQEMVKESGFTLKDCLTEVRRAVQTLLTSAEEAKRIAGEMVPVEGAPGFEDRLAFTMRVPVGVVCAITPFNSPLNTVAHKVGPALAAGNAVVLKPATYTPLTAIRLCQMLLEAGLPPGFINLVLGPGDPVGEALVEDARIAFYTFTGSTAVGKRIAAGLGLRRANMECGSISDTIVCQDANLERAAEQVCHASFRKAGQVCTSVQRLYVHSEVLDEFLAGLRSAVDRLSVGDPADPTTDVGPMISEAEAQRAEEWVAEAVQGGASIVTGGTRSGAVFSPTVLADVPPSARAVCEEIFAPVVSVIPYTDLGEVIGWTNDTLYGLQAGIFTRDLDRALRVARALRVGGVIINGSSSTRADLMPYGGVKDSGYGKEGPRYSIREMTEERLVMMMPDE
jgi:acyl-CoA reductase-like NAD-dependent aldehyde dehydrogenase